MNASERGQIVSALVEAHYAELFGYAYRLSGSRADAEDLTQHAFLTAQEKLDQLREADRARPWLFTIVRNAFLRSVRRKEVVTCQSMWEEDEFAAEETATAELTGEELTALLDELPEALRLPLVLFYFEEMSYRDIAIALNIREGTVMSRLSRGKSQLRARFGERRPVVSTATVSTK